MLVTYIRSSSFNNYSYCQMQYFLTYVLGHQSTSGKKAQLGTVVHKVMEVLAGCQHLQQDGDPADHVRGDQRPAGHPRDRAAHPRLQGATHPHVEDDFLDRWHLMNILEPISPHQLGTNVIFVLF